MDSLATSTASWSARSLRFTTLYSEQRACIIRLEEADEAHCKTHSSILRGKSVFEINDHALSYDGFRQTFAGPHDEILLIGYTFVSKGAIMPILSFPSG